MNVVLLWTVSGVLVMMATAARREGVEAQSVDVAAALAHPADEVPTFVEIVIETRVVAHEVAAAVVNRAE